jgi:RNA polymerase sigma-70 factor (ECF subfamily)
MEDRNGESGSTFEQYRGYVRLLAESFLDRRTRAKMDASDVAQETLIKAWQGRDKVANRSEEEISAWLRTILSNTILNARRDLGRQKRDFRREHSLDAALEKSSTMLRDWVASQAPSPMERAAQLELMDRIANALEELPLDQREAVALRHFGGASLEEIAERMDRSRGAVAVLIHRGLGRLRKRLSGDA